MIRSTLSTLTKQTMGRVRRRTSTKQRRSHWWCAVCATGAGEKRRTTTTPAGPAAAAGPWRGKLGTSASGTPERRLPPAPGFRPDRSPGLRFSLRRNRVSAAGWPTLNSLCGTCKHEAAPPFPGFGKGGIHVHRSRTDFLSRSNLPSVTRRLHRYYRAGYLHSITSSCYRRSTSTRHRPPRSCSASRTSPATPSLERQVLGRGSAAGMMLPI
jgi:hypothetical protein